MKARALRKILKTLGCIEVRQKGSHIRVECPCSQHKTTILDYQGEDLKIGTLKQIEKDLADCLGANWLGKRN